MAPTIPTRLLIKQYLRTVLSGIGGDDDWNNAAVVTTPHPSMEQIVGDADSPVISYQDEDESVDESRRSFSHDYATMVVSIRGIKKCPLLDPFEVEDHAEKMLSDIWRAVMSNPGMGCNAIGTTIVSPTHTVIMQGTEGWATCVLTVEILYRKAYREA
jgi:hypothetical protein